MAEKPLKATLPVPFTFSQSSLQDYFDCSRRFQLRYIEKLQWPAVETAPVLENEQRQLEGQQFHRMVQQYLIGLPEEKITRAAVNSKSGNLARWWENFLSARATTLADLTGQQYYPEQTLSVPTGSHRLVAKYDLITVKDNRAVIYDWKTYHKRPRDEWMAARLQTRVYLNLLVKAGAHLNAGQQFRPEQVEMVYWYAEYPSEPYRIHYDAARSRRDWDGINDLIREISSKLSFPLTSDEKKCGFCPFRSFCERGVAASESGEEAETEITSAWEVNLEQIQEIEF